MVTHLLLLLGRKKKKMEMMVKGEKVEKVEWRGEGSRWTKSKGVGGPSPNPL